MEEDLPTKGMAATTFLVNELVSVCTKGVVSTKKLESARIARNVHNQLQWAELNISE